MSSFFDKLKKGMGVEEDDLVEEPEQEEQEEEEEEQEEEIEEIEELEEPELKKKPKKKIKPIKIKKIEIQSEELEEPEEPEQPEELEEEKPNVSSVTKQEKEWSSFNKSEEGQLAIDVYQTEKSLVIQSTIAGVKPENLDISIERDVITIRGERKKDLVDKCDYFIQECFWGPFSREIIVPVEVDPEKALANMKENVLTIEIPKILREKKRKIMVRG